MQTKRSAVISFTNTGADLNGKIVSFLNQSGISAAGYTFYKYPKKELVSFKKLQPLIQKLFSECSLLIFVGAAGIAVRGIAPFLESKTKDPAVLVMDEAAKHVISLLSGHIGGANFWCRRLAKEFAAEPVITTATDVQELFAVDEFAAENRLCIMDMEAAKEVSARILSGECVGFHSEIPEYDIMPSGMPFQSKTNKKQLAWGVYISEHAGGSPYLNTCYLLPKNLVVGIGCRKGKTKDEIHAFLEKVLRESGLCGERISCFASIDCKCRETGILEEAAARGIPFYTFSAEELRELSDVFTASDFVEKQVGVDNVCERAAILGCNCEGKSGSLLVRKRAENGITVSIVRMDLVQS